MSTKTEYVCPVCATLVLETDKGIGCDGLCLRWFHRDCMKIPKSEYAKLAVVTSLKWHCTRADCKSVGPISERSNKIIIIK